MAKHPARRLSLRELPIYEPLESRRMLAVGPISDFSLPDNGMGGAEFVVGDVKFFSFNDGIHGYELWRADSSHPKGVLVKDVNPTPLDSSGRTSSSFPNSFFRINNTLLFVADDGAGGRELWRTDGTSGGTYRLFETKLGIEGIRSDLSYFPFQRGLLVLTSSDMIYTDGSLTGTRVLSRSPDAIFHANRTLYWIEGPTSRSVLTFDGTTLGTAGMTVPGAATNASLTLDHLGQLVFTARFGTASGQTTDYLTLSQVIVSENVTRVSLQTVKYMPIAPAPQIARSLGGFNGLAFYAIDGRGLWVTDGTKGLRQILPDVAPQSDIVAIGDRAYFLLESSIGNRRELWSTDGTLAGTMRVRMLDVQPRTSFSPDSPLKAVNDRLIFVVRANNRWEMRSLDPQAQRLEFLAALPGDRPGITISGDHVFFSDYDNASASGSFYRTDGTAAGTRLVYRRTGSYGTPQFSMHVLGERFILIPQQGYTDEIFDSVSVYSPPKPAGSNPRLRATFAGIDQMFMTWDVDPATVDGDRFEVWRTDGTDEGTIKLAGFTGQKNHSATALKNLFLFAVQGTQNQGGWHNKELWRSDGTVEGTFRILNISPKSDFNAGAVTNIELFASTPGAQFFVADDGVNGRALWKADGTAEGTVMLKSFGSAIVNPIESSLAIGNVVYFFTDNGVHGRQLWRSDGTSAGTYMIRPSGVTGSQLTDVPQLAGSLLVAPGFTRGDGPELFVLNAPKIPPRPIRAAHLVKGVLNIFGTSGNDTITVQQTKDEPSLLQVTLNGTSRDFYFSDVTLIRALLDAGHDRYDGMVPIRTSVNGGAGNDTIKTGDAPDTLYGGDGDDALYGAGGNDHLWGQAGNDRLAGGGGTDILWGGEGRDAFVASAERERRDHLIEDLLA